MKVGLVLGAGGTIGIAYHVGVLRALEVHAGFAPDDADLIVGTSAGSFMGAYVRAGYSTQEGWDLILGTHPKYAALSAAELAQVQAGILAPVFRSPLDVARRGIGSAYLLWRSIARVPMPLPPGLLRQAFPGGLFAFKEGRRRFAEELPEEWPDKPLYLVAVNTVTGKRVVLGKRSDPSVSLHDGVAASCAIPGVYQPVRVGKATLVDGGVYSTTNLDLTTRFGCDLVIVSAPMAYDPASPPCAQHQLVRRIPTRSLSVEAAAARRRGAEVLLIRPTAPEIELHGFNMMRRDGWDLVAKAAYDATVAALETPRFKRALRRLPAA